MKSKMSLDQSYLMSKYRKHVSFFFFDSFELVSVKELQMLSVFFRNYVDFLYFSVFTLKHSDWCRVCTSEIFPIPSAKESSAPA